MFQQNVQLPKHLINLTEEEQKKELTVTKPEPSFLIDFQIFNELCLIENCKENNLNFYNYQYSLDVSVDYRAEANDIYDKISKQTQIDSSRLRLWKIDKDDIHLNKVLAPTDLIDQCDVQNFFLEIKNEDELIQTYKTRIFFLFIYNQSTANPLFFLQTIHYGSQTLKFDTIINDGVKILNSTFNSKINKANASIYVYSSGLIKKLPSENCTNMNGTMMILQINEKLNDSLIDKNVNNMMINKKLNQIKKLYEYGDKQTQMQSEKSSVFNYFNFVHRKSAIPIELFFESKKCNKRITIYSFEDITKSVGIVDFVPTEITCIKLIQFIQYAFKIFYNDEDEIFLLFKYDEKLNLPEEKPIDQFSQPFSEKDQSNEIVLYYSIVSKIFAFDSTCKTRIVQLSKDGIKLDKIVGYYWPDPLIHPFKQFPDIHHSFFKNCNILQYRMFLVDINKDITLFDDDKDLTFNNETVLRIEKVPQNQKNTDLVILQKATVNRYDKIIKIGIPFFFNFVDNENISDFRKRLCSFLGCEIPNFKLHSQTKYIHQNNFINDKIHFNMNEQKYLYLICDN